MNKFKFYFIVMCAMVALFSCSKSNDLTVIPVRDYAAQRDADNATIEEFLKNHYLSVVSSSSYTDQDVTMPALSATDPTQVAIWYLQFGPNPILKKLPVTANGIDYTMYYIQLRDGDAVKGKKPCRVDQVLTSYKGSYLSYYTDTGVTPSNTTLTNTEFESIPFPENYIKLDQTIKGWPEVFRLFHSGTVVPGTDAASPPLYTNFGAGVVFIPSGLAYFYAAQTSSSGLIIPSYSPLIFSFKLYDVKYADQDGDGILSKDEDITVTATGGIGDGDFTNDDTDGDGIQNYLDVDDDGDGYFTKAETKKPAGAPGLSLYYPFNPVLDDPTTPVDESEPMGVPNCAGDGTTTPRLRKYLDPTCH